MPHLGIGAGVWLSDVPTSQATTHRPADGALLAVDVPQGLADEYLIAGSPGEIVGRWREFCVPAHCLEGAAVEIVSPPYTDAYTELSETEEV